MVNFSRLCLSRFWCEFVVGDRLLAFQRRQFYSTASEVQYFAVGVVCAEFDKRPVTFLACSIFRLFCYIVDSLLHLKQLA